MPLDTPIFGSASPAQSVSVLSLPPIPTTIRAARAHSIAETVCAPCCPDGDLLAIVYCGATPRISPPQDDWNLSHTQQEGCLRPLSEQASVLTWSCHRSKPEDIVFFEHLSSADATRVSVCECVQGGLSRVCHCLRSEIGLGVAGSRPRAPAVSRCRAAAGAAWRPALQLGGFVQKSIGRLRPKFARVRCEKRDERVEIGDSCDVRD